MKILLVDAFDRGNFSTRWRTYCVGRYLAARGHEPTYWHLTLQARDIPGVAWLPSVMQQIVLRLLMVLRALHVTALSRRADHVIVLNAYTSRWLARWLARRPNGFVYDTVDFADNEDFIRLHCPPGLRGTLMRWRMRRSYRTFLSYVDAARLVCTNNFYCIEQATARGKNTHLFIDPIPKAFLVPRQKTQPVPPLTLGWCGHPATNHYMREYGAVFRDFISKGLIRLELMEGAPHMAEELQAVNLPWSVDTFKDRVPAWDIGIAPLPSQVLFKGKFPGKILQYMAAGIPSIVTPKGMATHFIKDGETGLYAATGHDWRRCIEYFLSHPDEITRMGRLARLDFERRFSLEAQMPAYEATILRSPHAF